MTWLRWLFFVFGTLGSAAKVIAMGGVPWTKAYGIMFLTSFGVVECLIICSTILGRGSFHSIIRISFEASPIEQRLNSFDKRLLRFAGILHGILLLWVVADLWQRSYGWTAEDFYPGLNRFEKLYIWFISIVTSVSTLAVGSVSVWFLISRFLATMRRAPVGWIQDLEEDWIGKVLLWLPTIVALFFATWASFILFSRTGLELHGDIRTCALNTTILGAVILPIYLTSKYRTWFCRKYPNVAAPLLLIKSGRDLIQPDRGAFWYFTMFLYTLVLCIMWYGLRYNPEGTSNPSWGFFGS
jgi:hypothetical protein